MVADEGAEAEADRSSVSETWADGDDPATTREDDEASLVQQMTHQAGGNAPLRSNKNEAQYQARAPGDSGPITAQAAEDALARATLQSGQDHAPHAELLALSEPASSIGSDWLNPGMFQGRRTANNAMALMPANTVIDFDTQTRPITNDADEDHDMARAAAEWERDQPLMAGDEGRWGGRKQEDMSRQAISAWDETARIQWDKEEGDAAREWEEWQQSQPNSADLLEAIAEREREGVIPAPATPDSVTRSSQSHAESKRASAGSSTSAAAV